MKKWLLILALGIIAIIIGSVFVVPRLRLASLERSLYSEPDTKTKAAIAWKILESKSEQGIAALQKYARQNRLSAFDMTHNMFLLCDHDGSIHVAYAELANMKETSAKDKPRDKNDPVITCKITSMSLKFGDPPMIFEGIHLLDSEEGHNNFILKQESENKWLRISFEFNEEGTITSSSHDVTNRDLEQWRKTENWPEAWKHDSEENDDN